MVLTRGQGAHGFTLDPRVGEFLLSHPDIQIPEEGKIYSVNESYGHYRDEPTKKAVPTSKVRPINAGSLIVCLILALW